ncbi:hypothetical protein DD235_15020 [Corticimicrobacter populi]|uniref:Uncharacterized protein n=1 Tax=Corticimicrobacter populi TaxID=2175229 RepID=A0A2V1JWQ0_9BURK|nr:hypothetical protein DD235_15020 [Corticimicrobacter populi]
MCGRYFLSAATLLAAGLRAAVFLATGLRAAGVLVAVFLTAVAFRAVAVFFLAPTVFSAEAGAEAGVAEAAGATTASLTRTMSRIWVNCVLRVSHQACDDCPNAAETAWAASLAVPVADFEASASPAVPFLPAAACAWLRSAACPVVRAAASRPSENPCRAAIVARCTSRLWMVLLSMDRLNCNQPCTVLSSVMRRSSS